MELSESFTSSLDLKNHPMKNAKTKIKKQYYCVLRSFLYEIDKSDFALQRIKQYENFMNKGKHINGNVKIESLIDKIIICKQKTWRKNYKYLMLCDLALILLNTEKVEKAAKLIGKYVSPYYKKQINYLFEILKKPNSDITNFIYAKDLIEQYWKNKQFLDKKELKIIVTANMSAGKSTLINALVGKEITRTSQEVCTGNACYILNKPFEDNKIHLKTSELFLNADYEKLRSYKWEDSISIASFFRGFGSDEKRVCIIDTPGVNSSMNPVHSKITKEVIKKEKYDILLYILNASKLGTDEEIAYLKWVSNNVPKKKVIFVLNKVDNFKISEDNIEESINKVKNDLISLGYEDPIICPISAYYALLLKKKHYDNALTEDEEDEYFLYSKKFKRDEYDLSKYYKKKYESKEEFNLMSIKCGFYNLEKLIYEGMII